MATVDYSNYLEMQNQWVTSLVRIARDSDPEYARELAEIIAETLYRMLYLTQSQSRISTLPAGLYAGRCTGTGGYYSGSETGLAEQLKRESIPVCW